MTRSFFQLYKDARGQTVTEFLTFRPDKPNSSLSCIAQARENARMVRDQITSEMWEEINRLHLHLRSREARATWNSSPYEFFQEIKYSSLYLQGLIDATIRHNENWLFMQVGKYLERADKTTRILDVRHQSLVPGGAWRCGGTNGIPGMGRRPAFLQRVGRLPAVSPRRSGTGPRCGISFALGRFPPVGALLPGGSGQSLAAHFRRGGTPVLQRSGKTFRPDAGRNPVQHHQ